MFIPRHRLFRNGRCRFGRSPGPGAISSAATAALAGGQAPDIALFSDVWWFKFYINNALAPLDDLVSIALHDVTDATRAALDRIAVLGETAGDPVRFVLTGTPGDATRRYSLP